MGGNRTTHRNVDPATEQARQQIKAAFSTGRKRKKAKGGEAMAEEAFFCDEKFRQLLGSIPLSNSPYIIRSGASLALIDFSRKADINPRQLERFVRECIEDGKQRGGELAGKRPLDRFLTMLSVHFDAGLRSVRPHTTVVEFGRAFGEGTYYGTAFFIDMEGFTSATKKATGQTIGMLMHAQDMMYRLAAMQTGTITDNFTGDGRNTITIKASRFKTVIDAIMYGMMNVALVERFNRVNMKTWELGMLEGKELRIRQGENDGETSIRETSGRHTTYSAATNLAARIMSHGESGKLVISETMARVAHKHFTLKRRVLGQTVKEEIERFKAESRKHISEYEALGEGATKEERAEALLNVFTSTYMVQMLSDKHDSEFGGENRKKNQEWIHRNDDAEDVLLNKDVLGKFALTRDAIDELKLKIKDEVNSNPAYSRSLKGFKGFKEVKAYYVVEGVRGSQENPYIFPIGSPIREKYLGQYGVADGKGKKIEDYIYSVALPYGITNGVAPNMFFPHSVLETDMLDGEVGSTNSRTVLAVCAFRELVRKIANSPEEELEGTLFEKVSKELKASGVIMEGGAIDEGKMLQVEKDYVLLPSLLLETGKCRIADEMYGEPKSPADEDAVKRVARTHKMLTENPEANASTYEDKKMEKLEQIPLISAKMLLEHNEKYGGYFELFDGATLSVIEHTENGKKWREDLASLEAGGGKNPALTVACSQVVQVSHTLVREVMGRPWRQDFEPVDTAIKSTLERYEINRKETAHKGVSDTFKDLLESKGVSCKVYKDTALFPEA